MTYAVAAPEVYAGDSGLGHVKHPRGVVSSLYLGRPGIGIASEKHCKVRARGISTDSRHGEQRLGVRNQLLSRSLECRVSLRQPGRLATRAPKHMHTRAGRLSHWTPDAAYPARGGTRPGCEHEPAEESRVVPLKHLRNCAVHFRQSSPCCIGVGPGGRLLRGD